MKGFFKIFFASLSALIVFTAVPFFVLMGVVTAVSSMGEQKIVSVKPNSILHIDLSQPIVDALSDNPISYFDFNSMTVNAPIKLQKAIHSINCAAVDDKIEAIFLDSRGVNLLGVPTSLTVLQELRRAVEVFRSTGKKVYSYGIGYDNSSYYIGSVADHVSISPIGELYWLGFSADVTYFKQLFDKIGVDVDLVRAGIYKSAGEPFIASKMSDDNRRQLTSLFGSMWMNLVEDVSKSRSISVETLQGYSDNLTAVSSGDAMAHNMVDSVLYYDQFRDMLSSNHTSNVNMVSLKDYSTSILSVRSLNESGRPVVTSPNRVVVVNAIGTIVDGKSSEGSVGSETFCKRIESIRKDSTIKAVVLRINSPGGSAIASELMWRELSLLQSVKPLIVSMGQYAASGGYYIAAPADVILAEPTTITGSIGVFATIFNIKGVMDKIGINNEVIRTNKNSGMLSGIYMEPMNSVESQYFQRSVNNVYTIFKERVSAGRNLTMDKVELLAQGRVWSGVEAKENGLIDGFGGLVDAIYLAADRAGVKDNFITVEPISLDSNMSLFIDMLNAKCRSAFAPDYGVFQKEMEIISKIGKESKIQALVPYYITYR